MNTLVADLELLLLAGAAVGTFFVTVSDTPLADCTAVFNKSLSRLRMLLRVPQLKSSGAPAQQDARATLQSLFSTLQLCEEHGHRQVWAGLRAAPDHVLCNLQMTQCETMSRFKPELVVCCCCNPSS